MADTIAQRRRHTSDPVTMREICKLIGVDHTRRLTGAQLDTMRYSMWTAYDDTWRSWKRLTWKLKYEAVKVERAESLQEDVGSG